MKREVFLGWTGGTSIILVVWIGLHLALGQLIVPSPTEVFFNLARSPGFHAANLRVTTYEAGSGLILAVIAATGTVLVVGVLRPFRHVVYPIVTFLKSAPAVAFAPIFVSMVGTGTGAKSLTAALICFFPLVIGGLDGMYRTPRNLHLLATALGGSAARRFVRIEFPYCAAGFVSGLKTSAPLAVVGAIVGEFVAGGRPSGLGTYIFTHVPDLQTVDVFAGVCLSALLGFCFFTGACIIARLTGRRFNLEV